MLDSVWHTLQLRINQIKGLLWLCMSSLPHICSIHEKIVILKHTISGSLNMKTWFWHAICIYVVCMDVCSLVPEWLDRFYSYSELKSLFIIGQCPMNMNIPAPKIGTQNKMAVIISKTAYMILIKCH